MTEKNEQEGAELKDDVKEPPDGGSTPPPNQPEVQNGPPSKDPDQ